MSFPREPGKFYRMPVFFGPNPCPRWVPEGVVQDFAREPVRSTLGTRYLTDARALEAVLPEGFRLWGEPIVTVEAIYMTGFSWLAGGGYNMFDVKIPVVYASKTEGDVHGTLLMARWESLSDPITTGREELGHNKLFCDIPEVSDFNGRHHTSMSWRGFPFAKLWAEDLVEQEAPKGNPDNRGLLSWKYIPATPRPGKKWGEEADANYATLTPPSWSGVKTTRYLAGTGGVEWARPTFEQLPTQYTIVNGFASFPILESRGAYYVWMTGGASGDDTYRLD